MDIFKKVIKFTYLSNWFFLLVSGIYVYHSFFFGEGGYGLGAIASFFFFGIPAFYIIVQPVFYFWTKHFINDAFNIGFLLATFLANILADLTTIGLVSKI